MNKENSGHNLESLDIVSIATNQYVEYWLAMVDSANNLLEKDSQITFHVFTDQPDMCAKKSKIFEKVQIEPHIIPGYQWPDATLLRYKIILEHQQFFRSKNLMHLDSDMIFLKSPNEILETGPWRKEIALVQHPGFYRPQNFQKIKFYSTNKGRLFEDFLRKKENGALGEWETRVNSVAYVEKQKRKSYVCGATWIGKRDPILRMVWELKQMVDEDLSNSIIAKWNDESYLNKWASDNEHHELSPSFCYDPTYKQLVAERPCIEAVRKP